jgi:transposase-like protein
VCPPRGQTGQGNIRIHSCQAQRFLCTACHKTLSATKGTAWYRLRTPAETVSLVVTLMAHGCPPQAIVVAFGSDERTVACWLTRAGNQGQAVRHWIRQHNQQVKQGAGGVRVVVCPLPSKSPWLNPIEPKWVHGKRAVSEPDRLLSADELEARVYAYYGCDGEAHLVMPKKVA